MLVSCTIEYVVCRTFGPPKWKPIVLGLRKNQNCGIIRYKEKQEEREMVLVFDGFEVLAWIFLALMILIFIVGLILVRLKQKFEIWKDKRRKRKL